MKINDALIAAALGVVALFSSYGIRIPFGLEWLNVIGALSVLTGYAVTRFLVIPRSKARTRARLLFWIVVALVCAVGSLLFYQYLIYTNWVGLIALVLYAVSFAVFFLATGFIAACAQESLSA